MNSGPHPDSRHIQTRRALALDHPWLSVPMALMQKIPNSAVALLARFSIAAVFWQSAQTKIKGFSVNFVHGDFALGWPSLADGVVDLFESEYKLPWLSPAWGAVLSASAEHAFALLILLGLATRVSALGLLGITAVIQLLVYPGAYATHGVWASVLLWLMRQGPGKVSVDHWLQQRAQAR